MSNEELNNESARDGRGQEPMLVESASMPEETNAAPAGPGPGAVLRAARESHGWSVEQVADSLKLAPRQVHALESEDYASLPGMPIVRGFLRSYAKLLRIDADPLLVNLGGSGLPVQSSLQPREGLAAPFDVARLPTMGERPVISSNLVLISLLILLLVAVIWAARVIDFSGLTEGDNPAPEQSVLLEQSEPSSVDVPMPEAEIASAPEAGSTVPVISEELPSPMSQSASETAPGVAQPAPLIPAPAAAEPAVAPAEENAFVLSISRESWIQARRISDGRVVMSRLASPGEEISLVLTEPHEVVIGNTDGVKATLRGQVMPLKASNASGVARLNVK